MTKHFFGDCAARLCSVASQLLGWRPSECWDATPGELRLSLTVPVEAIAPDKHMIDSLQQRFPDE